MYSHLKDNTLDLLEKPKFRDTDIWGGYASGLRCLLLRAASSMMSMCICTVRTLSKVESCGIKSDICC